MAQVDVAIVNWNTSSDAAAAARAYEASEGVAADVVIFDNASESGQLEALEQVGDTATVILSDQNLGFGTAANRALQQGDGEYVLVSNADVLPEKDAVRAMVYAFRSVDECGMVAPVMDDEGYHDELPGPLTLLVRIPIGGFNRKTVPTPGPGEVQPVGQPAGACFLTSRAVWEEVGGFDERFFLWYEDVDLAKRLHDLGRTSVICGSARVQHSGGEAFVKMPEGAKQTIRLDSLGLYLRLHHRLTYLLSRPLDWMTRKVRAEDPGKSRPPG